MSHSCVPWLIHILWHDSFMCVSWLLYMCAMTHLHVSHGNWTSVRHFALITTHLVVTCLVHVYHDSFIRVPWLLHICTMTHSYVCRDTFTCVTQKVDECATFCPYYYSSRGDMSRSCVPWLIHMCPMVHVWMRCVTGICHDSLMYVPGLDHRYASISNRWPGFNMWHDLFTYVPWLLHMYMCRDSSEYVLWLIHIRAMTHSQAHGHPKLLVWFRYGTWLLHICATTPSYMCHDSFTNMQCLIHICAILSSQVHDHPKLLSWFRRALRSRLGPLLAGRNICDLNHCYVWHDTVVCVTVVCVYIYDFVYIYIYMYICIHIDMRIHIHIYDIYKISKYILCLNISWLKPQLAPRFSL